MTRHYAHKMHENMQCSIWKYKQGKTLTCRLFCSCLTPTLTANAKTAGVERMNVSQIPGSYVQTPEQT